MKKQGFTLIELMVVIVIMGILAAVAVPKLFAQIDKSKASEVGPAAGSYVHMQDAWVVDQASMGNWSDIGYTAPTSKNITYDGSSVKTSGQVGWQAGPNTTNWSPSNCTGEDAWKITVTVDGNTATYNSQTGCTSLTPNFTSIGASS